MMVPSGTSAETGWLNVIDVEVTAVTLVPLAMPVPLTAMPTAIPAVDANCKTPPPAAVMALVVSVVDSPGSMFTTFAQR